MQSGTHASRYILVNDCAHPEKSADSTAGIILFRTAAQQHVTASEPARKQRINHAIKCTRHASNPKYHGVLLYNNCIGTKAAICPLIRSCSIVPDTNTNTLETPIQTERRSTGSHQKCELSSGLFIIVRITKSPLFN